MNTKKSRGRNWALPADLYKSIKYDLINPYVYALSHPLLSLILWAKLANGLGSAPHLHVVHSLKFGIEFLTVVGLRVRID